MKKDIVVLTQNETLMREAMGEKVYRKICQQCGIGVRTKKRNKRTCPRCHGALRKATDIEARTDRFDG